MAPCLSFCVPSAHQLDPSLYIAISRGRSLSRLTRLFWILPNILLTIIFIAFVPQTGLAGGPHFIAGVSYFDAGTKGLPLLWAQGVVSYYTDQGDLSPLLVHASADAFVADAFSRWTSITTAAITVKLAGQLSEDVNGTNVIANGDGTFTMPTDIQPTAVTLPLAIVYDSDGAVTNALLGSGAGDSFYCFTNAVFGGVDNLSTDAHLLHALLIMNGNCAQSAAQLPDLKYRLVRMLGRVLGLDWSQVNINVITRNPIPTPSDYAGFSIMHATDGVSCVPISICYTNPDQPKMDDRASLSRLYPVTPQNQSNFPGKQLFFENTIRIHGGVHFVDAFGQSAQPMQGINVVARWVDPVTGLPSRAYGAASVSGFLFRGYAGNSVNGPNDGSGQPFDRFGSDDATVEGAFDLSGLEIPDNSSSARYELTVEAIDPLWSQPVGPYGPWQVQPSGAASPIVVTVNKGGDLQQDIVMQSSSVQLADWFEPADYTSPAPLPSAGEWLAKLSGYGNEDYFWFSGQNNRTLSVEVTALDESGVASQSKSLPVIGMWALSDPGGNGAPAATPLAFNTLNFGITRLDAVLLATTDFRLGISDYRGDGRPDFRYRARVFYGDKVIPARASVGGGTPLAIQGFGFRGNTAISIATANATLLAVSANQVTAVAPAMPDGLQSIGLADPATGSASLMTDALTYGAASDDIIRLIAGSNPATPVGGEAPNPIRVQVLEADGLTPVAGASVFFTATPAVSFAACGGGPSCTLISDESGQVSSRITVVSAGVMTISAVLAPASYPAPQQVQTTLLGVSSALDLTLASPFAWIAQGATVNVVLTARVLSNGIPIAGQVVNYQFLKGIGTLSANTTTTDNNGYSLTTLMLPSLAGDVLVSACAEPGDKPCQNFSATAVPVSALKLEPVAGSVQVVSTGQNFQPVTVRVTDSSAPPNPVQAANVIFDSIVTRPTPNAPVLTTGEAIITHNTMPVIVSSSQVAVPSDANGLATIRPSGGIHGSTLILGTTTTGASTLQFTLQSLSPINPGGSNVRKTEAYGRTKLLVKSDRN
jgi:IPT/TIG domain-containing protein